MKLVVDTNVVFSGLYAPGSAAGRLLLLALDGGVELYAPETVREELERSLRAKLGYSDPEWRMTLAALPLEWVEPDVYQRHLAAALKAIRDPTDAPVVALAMTLRCGVVSGDKDFHPLLKPVVTTWTPKDASSVKRSTRRRGPKRGKKR